MHRTWSNTQRQAIFAVVLVAHRAEYAAEEEDGGGSRGGDAICALFLPFELWVYILMMLRKGELGSGGRRIHGGLLCCM